MSNIFFKNHGPYVIEDLLNLSEIDNFDNYFDIVVNDIVDLVSAEKNTITFFHSKRYQLSALNTKASFCITTKNLSKF